MYGSIYIGTMSKISIKIQKDGRLRSESNPGPLACKAEELPLDKRQHCQLTVGERLQYSLSNFGSDWSSTDKTESSEHIHCEKDDTDQSKNSPLNYETSLKKEIMQRFNGRGTTPIYMYKQPKGYGSQETGKTYDKSKYLTYLNSNLDRGMRTV